MGECVVGEFHGGNRRNSDGFSITALLSVCRSFLQRTVCLTSPSVSPPSSEAAKTADTHLFCFGVFFPSNSSLNEFINLLIYWLGGDRLIGRGMDRQGLAHPSTHMQTKPLRNADNGQVGDAVL